MDDELRVAYATAMHAQQQQRCASVQIHVGLDVFNHLKSLATEADDRAPVPGRPDVRLWGFPLVLDRSARPEAISVHTVQVVA